MPAHDEDLKRLGQLSSSSRMADLSGRPAGIMAADLVGYSELISRDMHAAIQLLQVTRAIIMDAVSAHGGEVVQTPGDFVLAVFPETAAMLTAAYEAQLRIHNLHLQREDHSAGHWKIGLATGEVFLIDGDYYGNAINVASRLQSLAGPGETLFTEEVKDLCQLPRAARLQSIGEVSLRNIDTDPVVYKIDVPEYSGRLGTTKKQVALPPGLDGSVRKPILQIRNFRHIGKNEHGRFAAEALVDEVRLILARLSGSILIAGEVEKTIPDYVLHGSVQVAGDGLRIKAQLTSAVDGRAIWADRFNARLQDSFDFQDQIARDIVSALQLVLTEGEQAQLWRRATVSGDAWEAFQRGHDLARRFTREGHRNAKAHYEEAIRLDPGYLSALVGLGFCHLDELRLGWSADHSASIAEANRLYLSASSISDSHPDVLALGAYVKYFGGDPVAGKTLMRRAVELAPESAEIIAFEGALLDLIGDFEAAVTSYKLAISKSPFTPAWIAANLALTLLAMGEDVQAEKIFKQVIKNHPNYARAWIGLTVAFVRQKKSHEAQNSARTLLDLDPRFTVEEWASSRPFKDAALLERFVSDLRKAGLH